MQTAITKIVEVDSLNGSTPARVHRPTGTMFIDKQKFSRMPADQRFYVLLHEAGHATLNTSNEHEADSFAAGNYFKAGYPLSGSVKALTQNLDFSKPGHYQRAINQLNRALIFDKKMNTPKIIGIQNRVQNDPRMNISFAADETQEINDFLGIGKKSRERKADRKDKKQQRKLEKIEARADASVRKRRAGGGIGDTIGGIVGNIFGKKDDGAEMMMSGDNGSAASAPANNNKTYIIIGVVVVVIIIGLVFFMRKKK